MNTQRYRILDERLLSDGWGTLRAIRFKKEARDGSMREAKAELYDTGNAAAILPCNPETGTVLLIRQLRIATVYNGHPDGMLIEVIAGKIDAGLSAEETVIKESGEETGYTVHAVREVMRPYVSPGAFTERIYLFTGEYTTKDKRGEGGGKPEESENIEVMELPFSEALAMIGRGEIMDAKTIMLLQWTALHGVFKKA